MTDYPSIDQLLAGDGLLQPFERIAADLIRVADVLLVERTRDSIQIDCAPAEIGPIILVTPDAVDFRLPSLDRVHPGIPSPSSISWRRLDLEAAYSGDMNTLLRSARTARKRQFLTCRYCGSKVPPEHRHARDCCHGCAEQHLDVVH